MASGWRQDGVRMRQDGIRQAPEVCQGSGVRVRSTSGCVRMRQEGVRVASGRRQDDLASGWRQDDVKRRGARMKWMDTSEPHHRISSFNTLGGGFPRFNYSEGVNTHCRALDMLTRSRGGPGHGKLRRTRTSKQAGKALRSQGYPHALVM